MATVDVAGQVLNITLVEQEGIAWYDLRHPGTAEMAYLKEHFPFHPLDPEDAASRVQLAKVDEYPSYIFLVFRFPVFDDRTRRTRASQVTIFAGASYLVTIHRGELRPLTKLLQDCELSAEVRQEHMGSGTGHLLYQVLTHLVAYSFPVLSKLMGQVDGLEAVLFDPRRKTSCRSWRFCGVTSSPTGASFGRRFPSLRRLSPRSSPSCSSTRMSISAT